jgi:outer membrane protein assembly factor BamB
MDAKEEDELAWILRPIKLDAEGLPRWDLELGRSVSPLGCALTADAALLLTAYRDSAQLTAFSRGDGKQLWQVELPTLPVHDGLAVAPDGRIVVALRDGSVVCVGR